MPLGSHAGGAVSRLSATALPSTKREVQDGKSNNTDKDLRRQTHEPWRISKGQHDR